MRSSERIITDATEMVVTSTHNAVKTADLSPLRMTLVLAPVGVLAVFVQGPAWTDTWLYAVSNLLGSLSVAFVGIKLWLHTRLRSFAAACVVCGFMWPLQWAGAWNRSVLPFIGFHASMTFYSVGTLEERRRIERDLHDGVHNVCWLSKRESERTGGTATDVRIQSSISSPPNYGKP